MTWPQSGHSPAPPQGGGENTDTSLLRPAPELTTAVHRGTPNAWQAQTSQAGTHVSCPMLTEPCRPQQLLGNQPSPTWHARSVGPSHVSQLSPVTPLI